MNLYIGDLHFGHRNVINFDHRPFSDVEEMDRVMIQLWNARVQPADHVYVIGDFCYRCEKSEDWYLRQLQGHKHLVIGNHDGKLLKNERAMGYFESVDKMMHIEDNGNHICLCHYPIADWYKGRRGSWHIYGHIHNDRSDVYHLMKTREHALNAGACLNNYTPASLNELIRNNREFQRQDDTAGGIRLVLRSKATGEETVISLGSLIDDPDLEVRLFQPADKYTLG